MSLVKSARSKHKMPKDVWIVVCTRRGQNMFFYGDTRKDAIRAAGISADEVFTARRYRGDQKVVCGMTSRGTVVEYR
jgi:hypothetical protein